MMSRPLDYRSPEKNPSIERNAEFVEIIIRPNVRTGEIIGLSTMGIFTLFLVANGLLQDIFKMSFGAGNGEGTARLVLLLVGTFLGVHAWNYWRYLHRLHRLQITKDKIRYISPGFYRTKMSVIPREPGDRFDYERDGEGTYAFLLMRANSNETAYLLDEDLVSTLDIEERERIYQALNLELNESVKTN